MTGRSRIRRGIVVVLCAPLLLTGCASLWSAEPPAGGSRPGQGAQPTVSASPSPVRVAKPWQPGMRELGVNVLWENSSDDDDVVTRAKADRILDYIVSLHANSVALNFPFIVESLKSNAVTTDTLTPSPARIRIFLEEASARKVRVTLRPYLDERRILPAWRGEIAPTDRNAWFASYQAFLLPYLQAVQNTGLAEVVIGVELNSLQADPRWVALIAAARQLFPGTITYSANYDSFQHKSPAPAVDGVGVDAYFKTTLNDNATVAAITAAWQQWIDRYAGNAADKLVLHEVGIAAQSGAYLHPGQWGSDGVPINLTVQANWYAAVCQAAESTKLAGLYVWNVRMHGNPGHEDPQQADRMTFIDRPAEKTLRDCYARLSG
jgi:hypothetical protein